MSGRSSSTHVSELLGPAEYSLYYKDLVRFKISEPSDILNAQQTDTLSFTYFITRFDNYRQSRIYSEFLEYVDRAPAWYNAITNAMNNKGNKTEELMSIDHTKPYHILPDLGQPEDPALATEIIHIFTTAEKSSKDKNKIDWKH